MNFSSIPYLDPANWQQQGGGSIQNHHHHQLTSPPSQTAPPPQVSRFGNASGVGAGAGAGVGGVASLLSSGNLEHWRMPQQFPNFLGGFDPSNSPSSGVSNYPFQGGVHEAVQFLGGESTSQISRPKISTSMLNQMASVKMEDSNNNNNNQDQSALSRQLLGIQGNNENWNTASAWSDLSASFSSSSTSNAL
ncbi:hypothetical protein T459_22934 [Capsicum annuum]|uniref:Uncharacterized protein n=1 Tax=Capsicum annuum TaxID=4072 RepID=A0A2G2YQY4_CAPAN|nr:hypothetical protein T459_22934 [Capsicum annuum]